ncbi:hypothetical protein SVIOM342S_04080 [Streptomyces violaceorubidus]
MTTGVGGLGRSVSGRDQSGHRSRQEDQRTQPARHHRHPRPGPGRPGHRRVRARHHRRQVLSTTWPRPTPPCRRSGPTAATLQKADGPDRSWPRAAVIPVPCRRGRRCGRPAPTTTQLGKHPDPAARPAFWLDFPATGGDPLPLRLPRRREVPLPHPGAPTPILPSRSSPNHEPDVALTILLDRCGRSTDRWGTRRCHDLRLPTTRRSPSGNSSTPWTDARRGADILTVGSTVSPRSCHTTLL